MKFIKPIILSQILVYLTIAFVRWEFLVDFAAMTTDGRALYAGLSIFIGGMVSLATLEGY